MQVKVVSLKTLNLQRNIDFYTSVHGNKELWGYSSHMHRKAGNIWKGPTSTVTISDTRDQNPSWEADSRSANAEGPPLL
jgi:hypothetical protein